MLTGLAMFSSAFAKTQVSAYYYDCQDPFIQIFDKALKLIAKNYDCKAESFDAGSSVLLQKDQLNKAFENEAALIVNLIDPAMADGQTPGEDVLGHPHSPQGPCHLRREIGDLGVALGVNGHEAVAAELTEGFPHRRAAGLKHTGQLVF